MENRMRPTMAENRVNRSEPPRPYETTKVEEVSKKIEEFKAGTYGMDIGNAAAYMMLQLYPLFGLMMAEIIDDLDDIKGMVENNSNDFKAALEDIHESVRKDGKIKEVEKLGKGNESRG